jgi:mRNA interferase YafQ
MHRLNGKWAGSLECHVANIGDWLVVWQENENIAIFLRTGTHDEIFK